GKVEFKGPHRRVSRKKLLQKFLARHASSYRNNAFSTQISLELLLHAKAMYIEADGQHDMLITGSANPSAPAWLAGKSHRNAEAMIFRAGLEARQIAQRLGLTTLVEKPSVQPETWNEIATRVPDTQGVPESASRPSALAVEVQTGFSIPCPGMPLTSILDVQCLNEHFDVLSGRVPAGCGYCCGTSPHRLREINQPVLITRNWCSRPHPRPLTYI